MKRYRKTSKENTSSLFNRYIWLVETIQRKGKITFEEINDLWRNSRLNSNGEDIPLRTFHNHRKAIEEFFDINIECDKRNNYVYYIENEAEIRQNGIRSWLLNAFSVNNLVNESQGLKDRILFEKIPSAQHFLITFLEAIRDRKALDITYQGFVQNHPFTFCIEPYCLKIFKQRWYALARTPYNNQLRIYALDRLLNVTLTETTFQYPTDFNGENYFLNSFGIIVDETVDPQTVEIKAYVNKKKYIETLPLHHSQEKKEETDEYAVFSYFVSPTYDFLQELLSHGEEIEVLKPSSLRAEMARQATAMLSHYESKQHKK